jgi:hypothetical protein
MKRAALLLVLVIGSSAVGHAASLALGSGSSLGAARAATPRCTAAALVVTPTLSGSNVASLTVGNVPVACGGATLQATMSNGATSGSGSVVVPGAGGSVVVALSPAPALTTATTTHLVFVGP